MNKFTVAAVAACVAVPVALYASACTGLSRAEQSTPNPGTTVVYAGVTLPDSVSRDIAAHGGINACPTIDGDNCYWDAVRANNNGYSFVAWKGHYYYKEN